MQGETYISPQASVHTLAKGRAVHYVHLDNAVLPEDRWDEKITSGFLFIRFRSLPLGFPGVHPGDPIMIGPAK